MFETIEKITQVVVSAIVDKQIVNRDCATLLSAGEAHLTETDLTACLAEIRKQKEQALSQFYDQTINNVYGLALRITGKAEEAEEVVSDVYLQVWEQADRYRVEKGSIMAWLLTICRSRAIDRLRKQQQSSPEISDAEYSELIGLVASPEFLLSNIQQHSTINQALQKLSSVQRQLLSLAFFRGMTYQEIADFIDMPLGTVKSHIRRSLIDLKAEPSLQFCYSSNLEQHHG
jgi:RNA polymerase sigma-70 factor (ECF subfamily)